MKTWREFRIGHTGVQHHHFIGQVDAQHSVVLCPVWREIVSERTRDKLSAARRKGKWTGGNPVLGYDVDPRGGRLVVNEAEAERVREIFSICAHSTTIAQAVRELNIRGLTTKDWISKAGVHHRARRFQYSTLEFLIRNVVYKGQISHKGVMYPGEHEPVISSQLWDRVNQRHKPGARKGKPHTRVQTLLAGVLYCGACGSSLSVTYASRYGTRRVYYVCAKCRRRTEAGKRIRPVATVDFKARWFASLNRFSAINPVRLRFKNVWSASVMIRPRGRYQFLCATGAASCTRYLRDRNDS
ncbi:MAG: recombinase family protein [Bryobacteraceae bacterium]